MDSRKKLLTPPQKQAYDDDACNIQGAVPLPRNQTRERGVFIFRTYGSARESLRREARGRFPCRPQATLGLFFCPNAYNYKEGLPMMHKPQPSDLLHRSACKLRLVNSLISHIPPGQSLQLEEEAICGLFYLLDGVEEDIRTTINSIDGEGNHAN